MAKSKIHIKPSKKGTFTAAAKKHGKSVKQFEQQVLAHPDNYSPAMRKKANFSRNARGWKKGQDGIKMDLRHMPVDKIPAEGFNQNNLPPIRESSPIPTRMDLRHTPIERIQNYDPNYMDKVVEKGINKDPWAGMQKVKDNNTNWGGLAVGAMAAVDAILPHEKILPTVLPIQSTYNPYAYGTNTQAIYEDGGCMDCGGKMQKGGKVSKTGYKRTSKDKGAPSLRIPSNQITMHDVPYPVLGVDNLGNAQMMQPERDYAFPGTYVDEYPIRPLVPTGMQAQAGGTLPGQTGTMYARYADFIGKKVQGMEMGGYIDYNPPQSREDGGEIAKSGKWIQKAVNPSHKGFCSPMTKSTCTPRRKAFAMTMKKHHGFHKKEDGGSLYMDGGEVAVGQGGDVNIRENGGNMPYNPFLVEGWDGQKAKYIPPAGYGKRMPILYDDGGTIDNDYDEGQEYDLSDEQIKNLLRAGYKLQMK